MPQRKRRRLWSVPGSSLVWLWMDRDDRRRCHIAGVLFFRNFGHICGFSQKNFLSV
ncbi:hypothetical protein K438DRAFT_1801082 [Mycena galopus ATCC 62051]|nr:hypothetical protein K438DRAFT_1801082 [Mycena galopus ATCC 62051]